MGFRNIGLALPSFTTAQLSDLATRYGIGGSLGSNNIRPGALVRNSTTGAVNVFNGASFVAGTDFTPQTTPTNSVAPTFTGTLTAGSLQTAVNGTWAGSPVFTYQWNVGGVPVSGATSSTWVATSGVVTVTVTGSNSAGSLSVTSVSRTVV